MMRSLHESYPLQPAHAGSYVRLQELRAFSLVELMISLAIMGVLLVIMTQIITSSFGMWSRAEARTDVFREARAALHMVQRDLAAPFAGVSEPVLVITDGTEADLGNAGLNQAVYALAPSPNAGITDVSVAGFFCKWDAGKNAFALYRYWEDSDAFFTRTHVDAPPSALDPAYIHSPTQTQNAELLAAYVWNFRVVPGGSSSSAAQFASSELPQYLEVKFHVVSPAAARPVLGVVSPEQWHMPFTHPLMRGVIAPAMREFQTRVWLRTSSAPGL